MPFCILPDHSKTKTKHNHKQHQLTWQDDCGCIYQLQAGYPADHVDHACSLPVAADAVLSQQCHHDSLVALLASLWHCMAFLHPEILTAESHKIQTV